MRACRRLVHVVEVRLLTSREISRLEVRRQRVPSAPTEAMLLNRIQELTGRQFDQATKNGEGRRRRCRLSKDRSGDRSRSESQATGRWRRLDHLAFIPTTGPFCSNGISRISTTESSNVMVCSRYIHNLGRKVRLSHIWVKL